MTQNESRWHVPGREVCFDVGLYQTAVCFGKGVGINAVSLHEIFD